ncbi:MAG: DUF1631 domain-containing protein, partial [Gammaproteobacteria bacterium]|nr:DUF1631 domain-containing protein [Gammaproteobacteria bacterium]
FKSMNQAWLNVLHKKDEPAVSDATGEAAIEIDRMQRKVRVHYKILLSEVSGRFGTLAGRELKYNPVIPNHIYQSYWHATGALNLTDEDRVLLLLLFNRFVMDKAGKFIGSVNSKLEELKVEPLQKKPSDLEG